MTFESMARKWQCLDLGPTRNRYKRLKREMPKDITIHYDPLSDNPPCRIGKFGIQVYVLQENGRWMREMVYWTHVL